MAGLVEMLAGGGVKGVLDGLSGFARSLREAITGKAILDPNKQAEILAQTQEMEHALVLAAAEYDKAQMEAQMAVNKLEAQSTSLLKGGWRPSVGWVCVLGLGYTYLLRPILPWILNVVGISAPPLPSIDAFDLIVLLSGMLGLGGMRSLEKTKGVASK